MEGEMERTVVRAFDRIVIAVPELTGSTAQYHQLLGLDPYAPPGDPSQRAWFVLPNTVIELVETSTEVAHILGIVFASDDAGVGDAMLENTRDLDLRRCDGSRTEAVRSEREAVGVGDFRVDHLVLRTADADECIDLFEKQLGLRLALDQTVPEWGGRMLFFRTGKLTLEIIEPSKNRDAVDNFWGIAYQCSDLGEVARRLAGLGITVSEVRKGRKPGSLVATVKSHCLGIPTLLLQPA